MIFLILTAVLLGVVALYLKEVYSRFNKFGVKHLPPLPLLGTMARVIFRQEHFGDYVGRVYKEFYRERFVGMYEFISPVILIRDPELIKKITVKDFEHFVDHRVQSNKEIEPLLSGNLISLKGEEWKDMRSTLSPAFTSSKMRVMVPFMVEVGNQMAKTLKKKIQASDGDYLDIDVKDMTTRYATDVIATCAFGLKVDSHTDEQNEFYVKGKNAVNITLRQILVFFAYRSFPKLMKLLKFTILTEATRSFFRNIVLNTMKDRETHKIIRPDMIHLLMQAKKGQLLHDNKSADADAGYATVEESVVSKKRVKKDLTDDDLVAQAFLFFNAGFDTSSTCMSFLLHELAINPEVQEKLYNEIKNNESNNDGRFDYDSIQKMPYLDMVISESLRLWPPAVALDRVCVKDYNLGKASDEATKDYVIREGEGIQIPAYGIHRNPEFFPNPNKFDPERFSEENKHHIKSFTYMPFGLGPRNCIGSRFALSEVKVMTYQLLKDIELSPASKTQIPPKLDGTTFQVQIEGGHWVRMRVRN